MDTIFSYYPEYPGNPCPIPSPSMCLYYPEHPANPCSQFHPPIPLSPHPVIPSKKLRNRSLGYFALCTQKQAFETADLRGYTRILVFDCHSIRANPRNPR